MLILFVPIVVIIAFLVFKHIDDEIYAEDLAKSILLGFIFFLITHFICLCVCVASDKQIVKAESGVKSIYALNDIYLQYDESNYKYIIFEEGRGLVTKKARAYNSYINYTTETPYVEIYYVQLRNPVIRFLFQIPNMFGLEYHFYIPESVNATDDSIIDLE